MKGTIMLIAYIIIAVSVVVALVATAGWYHVEQIENVQKEARRVIHMEALESYERGYKHGVEDERNENSTPKKIDADTHLITAISH